MKGRFVVLCIVKTQRGSGGVSLTSVLGAGELSASRPVALHRRRTAGGRAGLSVCFDFGPWSREDTCIPTGI